MSFKLYYRVAARVLIPSATVMIQQNDLNCKPSELPIYSKDEPKNKVKPRREPGVLEQQICQVRHKLTKQVDNARETIRNWSNQGCEEMQYLVNYLEDEDNTTPRAGAIAIGGLTGYILALRGGLFRKIIFTLAGGLGMAAVCYPKEAAEYSTLIRSETKNYIRMGYDFYRGIVSDQPKKEEIHILGIIGDEEQPTQIEVDPMALVAHVHTGAIHENCHCPIGTCLNPKDEAPISSYSFDDKILPCDDEVDIPACE